MDYEGYTFVFFYQNINKIFSLKCYIYYALTFQQLIFLNASYLYLLELN